MATRCKFRCVSVTQREGSVWGEDGKGCKLGIVHDASFVAVTGGSEENQKFFASTPSGNLNVATVRENQFQVGKYYYLTIEEAPA